MDPNNSQLYVQSNKEQSNSSTGTTRKRTRATPEQLTILEKTFAINPSPNSRIREQLARELAMSERSIQIWFQNRRAKVKNVAKKSSMLRDETLRMQYYASNAAIAACKAAMYQQQQQTEGHQTIESNPDLYYYYYYYYFNQQQQSRNYNMPPPPPPPQHRPFTTTTASPKMTNDTLWSKKQMYQQRARAHTIGPSSINFNIGPQQDTTFTNLLNNTTMSPTPFEQQEFLPYSSASPSLFEQQTLWSSEIPFYENPSSLFAAKISAEVLQIGTWKRMTFEPNDLICQFDKEKQIFSWCIQDGLSQFKMDMPQHTIKYITLQPLQTRPGWARLQFELKDQEHIAFYMYNNQTATWVQCRDYTEDKQATLIGVHQLDGPALALKAEFDTLLRENEYLKSITHTYFV